MDTPALRVNRPPTLVQTRDFVWQVAFNYWLGDFLIGAVPTHILYKATAVPRYGALLKMVVRKKWNFTRHESKYLLVSSVFSRVRRIAKGDCYPRHVLSSSVRMEQLGSHWTDFLEIRYLSIFRKSVGFINI
jgi:hypothetical protein